MEVSQFQAKDVILNDGLAEYEKGMSFFYSELAALNTIIYIAEQVMHFPFHLFVTADKTIFFSMVMRSFYESALLIITRLATDQAGDLYTLPRFKNMIRELVKPEFKNSFLVRLKKVSFDKETDTLLKRAQELRNHGVAHTTQAWILGSAGTPLNISELRALSDALKGLLDTLSFNVEYKILPLPYDPRAIRPKGKNLKTDIEELLDCIAKDSYVLNMPETHPERWRRRRPGLAEDKIKQLNAYRRKFGLPDA